VSAPGSVLVVGASAAGLGVAEALRHKGYAGQLTVLGAEPHLPYDRPPLSKQLLAGTWEPEKVMLRKRDHYDGLKAQFILGDPAVSLDAGRHVVRTACGRTLRADAIVIATGLRARTMPGGAGLAGVHVLRSLHDALGLRSALQTALKKDGARIVVVGDGVLGAEIAATACGLGLDVTMTGPQNAPLEMQFGPLVSGMLADLHSAHGVTLKLGTGVDRITGSGGRVTGVRLVSGEVLPADLVVVSVGGIPETDWLDGSGLEIANGIVCDSRCRALGGRSGPAGRGSTSDIYAAGDVARWHHEHLGAAVRLENRTNATDSAWAVAAAITGETGPYAPVPYMWTDQHSVKIQVHGMLSADAEVTIADGDPETADENGKRRFVARFTAGGRVTGVLGWNMPKQTRLRRQEILDSLPN
jgi:NADPH-dependent 2,4-dienoyl-CoA reductase/sulfur reductase-like enzyme